MIVLLGVPGSGKGTQGQLLAEGGKCRWLSMGEIFRQKASESQKQEMLKGNLLDSKETINLLNQELEELGDRPELIIDGFPRYIDQAEWLLSQHMAKKIKVSAVINLYANKEVVKERLLSRGRADDSEQTISNRFDAYEKNSLPATDVLNQGGIPVIDINADQTPEAIHEDIIMELQKLDINI